MKVTLLRCTENPLNLISQAYRLCYASMPKDNPEEEDKFIKACIKNEHTSPIEHASATFLVEGISRTCSHQLVRHRLASYTQESQRYVDAAGYNYTIPESVTKNKKLFDQFKTSITLAELTYKDLVKSGVKKEDARFILPQAIHTKIMVTINFRALRNLFNLRLDKRAQWEIRHVAADMVAALFQREPRILCIFGDILEKHSK